MVQLSTKYNRPFGDHALLLKTSHEAVEWTSIQESVMKRRYHIWSNICITMTHLRCQIQCFFVNNLFFRGKNAVNFKCCAETWPCLAGLMYFHWCSKWGSVKSIVIKVTKFHLCFVTFRNVSAKREEVLIICVKEHPGAQSKKLCGGYEHAYCISPITWLLSACFRLAFCLFSMQNIPALQMSMRPFLMLFWIFNTKKMLSLGVFSCFCSLQLSF